MKTQNKVTLANSSIREYSLMSILSSIFNDGRARYDITRNGAYLYLDDTLIAFLASSQISNILRYYDFEHVCKPLRNVYREILKLRRHSKK